MIEVNDLLSGQYSPNKHTRFKTSILRQDLCNYSDANIVVKGRKSVAGTNNANKRDKKLTFKNNSPFRSCISIINYTFANNTEELDIVMPMYSFLQWQLLYGIRTFMELLQR